MEHTWGYLIMTGHQMLVIAPTALGRPNKLFLHILRVGEWTSLEIAEVLSTSVAVSAETIESTKVEFIHSCMSLPLCLSPKRFPIASMNAIKTCVGQKRGVRIQDLLPPHSSSPQEVTELVSQNEEINLEEPRIAATAKIGIEFMRSINPLSSSYVRRARPPWEDSERGRALQDTV